MKVYVVSAGYYEETQVEGIGATYEAAARIAEGLHPQEDHFFGMDQTCPHWKGNEHSAGLWDCTCTTQIAECEVLE